MPANPLPPLTAPEIAELARLAEGDLPLISPYRISLLAVGVTRLLADLARVEGEREEARAHIARLRRYYEGDAQRGVNAAMERMAVDAATAIRERDTARAESARLAGELVEARAALENEYGTGEPPSPGWGCSRAAVPGGWIKMRPPSITFWIASVGMEHGVAFDGTPFRRWRWFVPGEATEKPISGHAPTAREAMRQADLALAGGAR